MLLKALFLCDDVRVELGDTISAVGILAERVVVGPGPIVLAKLSCVGVIRGLRGVDELRYRLRLGPATETSAAAAPAMGVESHAPDRDEHTFYFVRSPVTFDHPGTYRLVLEVEAAGERAQFECPLELVRGPAGPP